MKWHKKILIGIAVILLLVVALNIGLNFWIARQLPHIINEQNDSPYLITYKDLNISLLSQTLKATEIIVVPKSSLDIKAGKPGIYANIESLEVNRFKIWDLVFSNKIVAKNLIVEKPQVTLLQKDGKAIKNSKSIRSEVVKPFSKIIYVSDVYLNHAEVKITEIKNNKPILNASNLSLKLEGIFINEETLEKKIPFTYQTYSIDCDSLYYRANAFYHLETGKIATTNNGLKIAAFKMVPEYSRKAFVKAIPTEKDIYAISATDISVHDMVWGFKNEAFYFNTRSIVLDDVNANIYRNKLPKDDLTKKELYNKLLRDIPFEMKVDTLQLKNSKLVYEEEKDFELGAGKLIFSKFNLTATGIASGFKQTKLPPVKIKVKCQFMDSAPMHVNWTFNILDQSDGFNIKGHIYNFPAERLIPFTKPYINAEVKGDLDEVYFNFTGNDNHAKGDFAINYDHLKVSIYKKNDRKKKNKLLTAVANLFVKKDTKDKVKSAEIAVDRIQEKSFYNYLWRSIAEGLKKILI